MREIFTDKDFKTSKFLLLLKIILIIALVIFFLPLFILPFFNHPFADDYISGYYVNHNSFLNYQQFVYANWSGRFAATFTGALFARGYFLYNHYYLHSLLLIVLDFTTLLFLIHTVFKYILQHEKSLATKATYTFIFLALQVCCVPELSTFLFWFSSAITYLMPVILVQAEIALLVAFFNTENKLSKNVCTVLLPLLVFTTIGFNELFIVVQLVLFIAAWRFRLHKKCPATFIIVMLMAFAAATALLFLSPGISIRRSEINSKNIGLGVVAVCYQSAEALWNIFKNPFTWVTAAVIFFYADKTKSLWKCNTVIKQAVQKKWWLLTVVIIFVFVAVALPVIALKGGTIPERYLDAVVCIILLFVLPLFFIAGCAGNVSRLLQPSAIKIFTGLLLFAAVLANDYIPNAYQSLIIAPVYNLILNEREAALKQASAKNKIVMVNSYDKEVQQLLQTKYKDAPVTLQTLLNKKPPLLFFEDDLETPSSVDVIKKFYGADSLIIKTK